MFVCVSMCVYVYVCVYIHRHTDTYTHSHMHMYTSTHNITRLFDDLTNLLIFMCHLEIMEDMAEEDIFNNF